MENLKCEICGSSDITIHKKEMTLKVSYGSEEIYTLIEYECNECMSTIQSSKSCDYQDEAYQRSKENSAHNILCLLEKDYNFITYERLLDIPIGTFSAWKSGKEKMTDSDIALLKIVLENTDLVVHT